MLKVSANNQYISYNSGEPPFMNRHGSEELFQSISSRNSKQQLAPPSKQTSQLPHIVNKEGASQATAYSKPIKKINYDSNYQILMNKAKMGEDKPDGY